MLRYVPLLLIACACVSEAVGQQTFRVFAVDLLGDPIPNVEVSVQVGQNIYLNQQSDADGIATAEVPAVPNQGGQILVNMENRNTDYIGRRERFNLNELRRFTDGIAVPLWKPGDVKSLADVVVRNPAHIGVAVQRPRSPGSRSYIVLKLDQNVDGWVSSWAPDLPQVVYPQLAQALYADLEPGDAVPPEFDAALQRVYDEIDRRNGLTRFCRNQVAAGQFPPRVPPQQPPVSYTPPQRPPVDYPGFPGCLGHLGRLLQMSCLGRLGDSGVRYYTPLNERFPSYLSSSAGNLYPTSAYIPRSNRTVASGTRCCKVR